MTGRCGGATSTLDLPVCWKVKARRDEMRRVPRVRIGELAERAGISAKAICYYEQIGVLAPPTRTPSGSRDDDHTALGRLALVHAAQAVGYSLVLGGLTLVWSGWRCWPRGWR